MNLFMNDPTIWVLVSFVIFVAGAIIFGRKTVIGMLDAKINAIRTEIANAEHLREHAQRLLQEYETKQKAAQSEAERMLAAAKKQAADLHQKAEAELSETLARRESMMADRIKRMEEAAKDDIRRYAADLAISATGEIIAQKMDQATASRLADESIRKVGDLN
jgi:F-type H+-transporting ATPase subunit b